MTDPTSRLEIVEVDASDDAAFGAWHSVYEAAERALPAGVSDTWQPDEVRVLFTDPGNARWRQGYAGVLDGEVVASGQVELSLRDNLDRADVLVHVSPARQRHGHGSTMLAHLEQVARARSRRILVGEAAWPYSAGLEGHGVPAAEFARRHGYSMALGDVKRRLDLPVDEATLDALARDAAAHQAAHQPAAGASYEVRAWEGPVPDELLEGWAALTAAIDTEAPQGDLEIEPENPDPALVREREAVLAKQGRRKYNAVALSPEGDVVGYTDLCTTVHEPGKAYQWGTLVRRDARGHRLGLALKVANLRLLQRLRPDIREITTYNAEVNAHMIGVNERLGYRPAGRLGEFQKLL